MPHCVLVKNVFTACNVIVCLSQCLFAEASAISPKIKEKIQREVDTINSWAGLPDMIQAVQRQNAEKLSMDSILKRDTAWIAIFNAAGKQSEFMHLIHNNQIGLWLKNKRKQSKGKYRESFLCDNQGALVGASGETSDYFQGDEDKWIESFNRGQGKVYYSKPEYDTSADAVLVRISAPVISNGATIGVLVVGVKYSELK